MIRRPPRSTLCISSAASDVSKRQRVECTWQILALDTWRVVWRKLVHQAWLRCRATLALRKASANTHMPS
eukprot:14235869-Alexandrium_andersonii.AAC.1